MNGVKVRILNGDAAKALKVLATGSHHCCITSPPYWGLRDYSSEGQIGVDPDLDTYLKRICDVFDEVARVLREDGTLWLVLGDCFAGPGGGSNGRHGGLKRHRPGGGTQPKRIQGLPRKNLVGVPWRVAFALQARGWILRSDIVWHKPAPMPESVRDRPTRAHEFIFLFARSPRYYFDSEAINEAAQRTTSGIKARRLATGEPGQRVGDHLGSSFPWVGTRRNIRDVWTIHARPFKGCHFATFPPDLVVPCVKAGSPKGGHILDPFGGSGTTGLVAADLGRNATLVEINPAYCRVALSRQTIFTEKSLEVIS